MSRAVKSAVLAAVCLLVASLPIWDSDRLLHVFGGAVLLIGSLAVLAAAFDICAVTTRIARARR